MRVTKEACSIATPCVQGTKNVRCIGNTRIYIKSHWLLSVLLYGGADRLSCHKLAGASIFKRKMRGKKEGCVVPHFASFGKQTLKCTQIRVPNLAWPTTGTVCTARVRSLLCFLMDTQSLHF